VIVDVRNVVGRLGAQLQAVVDENSRQVLAGAETQRANEQLAADVARLELRVEVLEHENRRLTEGNEVVKRGIGDVSDCRPKVKKDLMNLERELAQLKEEMRATRPKAELAPPSADATVTPAPASSAPANPAAASPQNVALSSDPSSPDDRKLHPIVSEAPLTHAPVKVSPPPAPPKQAKQFHRW
jgi:outer membrane murein-binding lipoprotein Lpp